MKPQHSVANIIFKRKTIQLQIYDYKYADRDTVDIYWNGLPIKYGHVLKAYPGTTFTLNLAPSAILAAKNHFPANTLVFFGRAGSFFFGINMEPGVTLAVKVKNPATIFPGGPFRKPSKPLILNFAKNFPRLSDPLSMAVGLACISPINPQSILHIEEARSSIPTDFQPVRREYILTVDRDKPGNSVANKRGRESIRFYLNNEGKRGTFRQDLDEYLPKVFLENCGRAHVKPIIFDDNRRAGNDIQKFITGLPGTTAKNATYKDGDQIEIVVPNFYGLFCRDAF